MTYGLSIVGDKPTGAWILDGTSPFPDISGYGNSATCSSTNRGVSLVAGAVYSTIVSNTIQATFPVGSIFSTGYESNPFTIEAWARPINKTTGQAALNNGAVYTNLALNPLPMNTTNWGLTNTGTGGAGSMTYDGVNLANVTTVTTQPTSNAWTVRYSSSTANYIPVTAGQRYYFSFEVNSSIQDYRALGIDFRDSTGLVSVSNPDIPRVSLPPGTWVRMEMWATAPTNAAYASPLVYAGTSGANAAVIRTLGSTLSVRKIVFAPMTGADVSIPYFDGNTNGYEWAGQMHLSISQPSTYIGLRTNRILNPSMETNASNWSQYGSGNTFVTSTGAKYNGNQSGIMNATATGTQGRLSANMPITAGKQYSISGYLNTVNTTTSNNVSINYIWKDAVNGVQVGTTQTVSNVALGATVGWARAGIVTQVAPAGAAALEVRFYLAGAAINDAFYLDGVMVEEATTIRNYFDGSYTGASWTGTANASTSTMPPYAARNLVWNGEPSGTKLNAVNTFRTNLAWSDSTLPAVVGSTGTLTTGVSADGVTWTRWTGNGAVNPVVRKNVALAQLSNGQTYTASWEIYNDSAAPITLSVDWCDVNATSYTIAAGARRVISCTASKNPYDTTYRFTDLNMNPAGSTESFLFREIQVELGQAYNPYFDGSTGYANVNLAKAQSAGIYRASDNAVVQSPSTSNTITNDSAKAGSVSGIDYFSGAGGVLEYAQVDLGSIKSIDTIKVWHYYDDGRTYNATKTQISVDGTTWTTVFDSATSGTYAETSAGRTTTFTNQPVRYIRDYLNGNSVNTGNQWKGISVYDTSASNFATVWSGTVNASNSYIYGIQYPNALFSTSLANGTVVGMTESGTTFNRFIVPANANSPTYRIVELRGSMNEINPWDRVTITFQARAGGGWSGGFTTSTITIVDGANLNGISATGAAVALTSSWQTVTRTITAVTKPGTGALFYWPLQNGTTSQDSWVDVRNVVVTVDSPSTAFFDGDTFGARWDSTVNGSGSVMLPSDIELQILGNNAKMDGLVVTGQTLSFVTKYTDGSESRASATIPVDRNVHVVGTHTKTKNNLYIDGVLVDSEDVSTAQQALPYVATDTNLYSGATYSSRNLSLNGVAVYPTALSAQVIANHFAKGRATVGIGAVEKIYGGERISLASNAGDIFNSLTWKDDADWNSGSHFYTIVQSGQLKPQMEAGITVTSNWKNSFYLGTSSASTIYGVNMYWEGIGATVEASLDGTTWETAVKGKNLLICNGINPANQMLLVRVSFAGGLTGDTYLDNLTITGYNSGVINTATGRTVTLFGDASINQDLDVAVGSDLNGVIFDHRTTPGYMQIAVDTMPDALAPMTVEVWYKVNSDASPYRIVDGQASGATTRPAFGAGITAFSETPVFGGSPTIYKNGQPNGGTAQYRLGEWQVLHLVASNVEGFDKIININKYAFGTGYSGDITVGQVVMYNDALTAAQILEIYQAYVGVPRQIAADASVIALSEDPAPVKIYGQDWSIQPAG